MRHTLRTSQYFHLPVIKPRSSTFLCSRQLYPRKLSCRVASHGGLLRVVSREGDVAPLFLSHVFTSLRCKGYNFYINLEDPEDTRRSVEEDLERLAEENRTDTTAYLHSLLNLALSHYQSQDYIKARKVAEYTHERAFRHNRRSSFIFLTAKTCSRCASALADEYEAHLRKMESHAEISAALAPKPSVVFSARRTIEKLRQDAVRFDGIATRVYNRPDLAFMRGDERGKGGEGFEGGKESSGSAATKKGGSCNDRRRTWSEDACAVDEEFEAPYGPRWQERRKRPEHVELRRYYQKQQPQDAQDGGSWKIPK
ncbi:unnamed protein product [Phytomonas sp. EM1]|nr:unnamed protein product [Phytomonas sp. EM1]|eukprot:CCW64711.1 unnamed protein product [Phytomonas sp. isolate EM1]